MAETSRIRVAKDKAELVKALTSNDGATGPFQTFADVVVFAAALGAKHKRRVPLGEISKREPSPIRLEHFATMGHDWVIKLLGITESKDIKILSPSHEEEYEQQRNHIFEEYANGGLEILQNELRGAVDYTDRVLLMLSSERFNQDQQEGEFDLTRFLP
ncbi:DNA phosphorothioation-associated protein 4 [Aetokthonos hydrillicola Thurmond2011]|jgi:dnd system-associated protein 4|uniref:DNA phosphorothioation-associated protein 4 n=1 Tax=Aetokthonos hydrillicola Thurmond2011 TaxID=2712845 RepID=A0AAP5I113_9CYAN|nr:DNA phosphorothioation-associated protein 4 [Aetokthonos hydrillicola]MBO3463738.1 DNA phosphorothioation-associated protein 4 [Aetokthonos hydrillicola CCALA 1050]MBW4589596.1 DNA phosphorothioation-associated protein 4 [Aetokthonos hydrillicola CCALA 1050]MDR9893198.1 DNA phosphorothioation-associated protein 4 [Aetokthonos hydrillicola Thurmond2011]